MPREASWLQPASGHTPPFFTTGLAGCVLHLQGCLRILRLAHLLADMITCRKCRLTPHLQVEGDVFATSGSDRGIALYDLRSATPIRKLVMQVMFLNFGVWADM